MTLAIVQQTALTNKQISASASLALNGVSAGNTLFALLAYDDSNNHSSTPATVGDGQGAYTLDVSQVRSHNSAQIYSLWNAAAGTHSLSSTAAATASGNWTWLFLEVSGLGLVNSLDQAVGNTQSTNAPAVSSGTLAQSLELAFAIAEAGGAVTGLVTPTGWNNLGLLNSSFPSGSFASLITSSTGALSPTFGTMSGSGFAAVIATYKALTIPTDDLIGQAWL